MLTRWSKYIGAVGALLLVSVMVLVVMMVGANLIQAFSVSSLNQADWKNLHPVQATFTARSILNAYYILCGIAFFGFFFLMEHRLVTTGVPKRLVLRRTFLTLGIELSILALLELAMMIFSRVLAFQVGMTVIEILLGIGLIYLGRRKAPISLN